MAHAPARATTAQEVRALARGIVAVGPVVLAVTALHRLADALESDDPPNRWEAQDWMIRISRELRARDYPGPSLTLLHIARRVHGATTF